MKSAVMYYFAAQVYLTFEGSYGSGGDGASTINLPKPEGLIASRTNVETLKLVDLLQSHSMQVDNGYNSPYDLFHIPTLQ